MWTTADLPAGFRPPDTPAWRAQMAAQKLGLSLDRHEPSCTDTVRCTCVLAAVIAVIDAARPPEMG